MSISITSGRLLQNLYNNNNGSQSYYTGVRSQKRTEENSDIKSSVDINSDFRKALKKLKNADYKSGLRSDIKAGAKKLVESYNDLIENGGDGSKKYADKLSSLKEVFDKYSDELSKAGITADSSTGKLKFDSDAFDDADMDDLEKVFSSESDFVSSTDKILTSMNKMIKNSVISIVNEDTYVANYVNSGNIPFIKHLNSLAVSTELLNNTVYTADNESYVQEILGNYIDKLEAFYDTLGGDGVVSSAEYTEKAVDDFDDIIRLNNDFVSCIETGQIDYNAWFSQSEDSYGYKVNTLYKDMFNEMAGTAKKDFEVSSFIDYQA